MLREQAPEGVAAWPRDASRIDLIDACIQGPPNSPYERGSFRVEIRVPERHEFVSVIPLILQVSSRAT